MELISSRHFDKDEKGRWVILFGHYDGKRLKEVPTRYLQWMLDNVEFVRGPFRTSVGRMVRDRYHGIEDEPCIENDRGGDPGHDDLGIHGRCDCDGCRRDREDADWMFDEGFGDR